MHVVNLGSYIHPDMAILFVPLNPPDQSDLNGHYFSRVSTFFDILIDSGLIKRRITNLLEADEQVFGDKEINFRNLNFGIKDLVSIVETDSRKVKATREDMERILNIADVFQPGIICLMHSKVRKAFSRSKVIPKNVGYGKIGLYKNSIIYAAFVTY